MEGKHGVVLDHVFLSCRQNGLRFRESVAVLDDRTQGVDCLADNPVTLGIELFSEKSVLLVDGNGIFAMYLHDTVMHPLPVIAPKPRQLIHAEPKQSVESELESVLSLEFREDAVPARAFLEGLEFIHGNEAHVGTACKAHSVNQPGAEPRLDLPKVNANVVSPAKELLHQTFETGFSRIPRSVHKESLFHTPTFDVGKTRSDELEQELLNLRIPVCEGLHETVEYRSRKLLL